MTRVIRIHLLRVIRITASQPGSAPGDPRIDSWTALMMRRAAGWVCQTPGRMWKGKGEGKDVLLRRSVRQINWDHNTITNPVTTVTCNTVHMDLIWNLGHDLGDEI